MDYKKSQKIPKKFHCELCDYNTSHKNDYIKHLQSKKHHDYIANTNDYNCECGKKYKYRQNLYRHKLKCNNNKNHTNYKNANFMLTNANSEKCPFSCECGKSYKHKSSFSRHNQICKYYRRNKNLTTIQNYSNNEHITNMIMKILEKNTELLEEVKEIAKEPKIFQNITNNNNTTHNTQFNIMNYLNNDCKDAMNLTDFISELSFSLDDLEVMGTKGYQQSMEETFIKQLRDMEKTKRPIHCSDRKRKSFYIKDDNLWEKDEDNSKIVNGLKKISQKHLGMLSAWTNYNKNWSHNERKQDFFNKSVQEVAKYNDYKQINKIISKLTGLTIK
jgi:hypothetical protein